MKLALIHPSATAVWPPTGIALAALILLGTRAGPAIFIGAFLVNLTTAGSVATSLGIAAGNALEGIVGAYLVTRFAGGRDAFDRIRNVFKFAILAALLATTVSATIGVATLCLGGLAGWADVRPIWTTWWLGDATGALLVTPFCLLWLSPRRLRIRLSLGRTLEAAALLFCLALAGFVVFGWLTPWSIGHYPLEFLCVPPLLWAAYRFDRRVAATAVILLSIMSIGGTLRGFGPFLRGSVNESLLLLQSFLGIASISTLALAVAVSERRGLERILSLMESAVRDAVQGVVILATEWRAGEPRIAFANDRFARMTGRSPADLLGETLDVLDILETDGATDAMRRSVLLGERFDGVARARRADGSVYAVEIELSPAPSGSKSPTHWIGLVRDVSERIAHLETLEHQALHDFLTGLPNRVLLRDRLGQAILSAERDGIPLALFLLDLDRFKSVNDTFGHYAGDLLLEEVGCRLRDSLRTVDTVARLGGDEFAILLPTAGGEEAAVRMAEKILAALEEPFRIESHTIRISASIGIALCPQHGRESTTLMRQADLAMYAAKRSNDGWAVAAPDASQRLRTS